MDIPEKSDLYSRHYILGLKENQPTLLENARLYFEEDYLTASPAALSAAECYAQTIDKGHGRIDKREYWLMKDHLTELRRAEAWEKLNGIAVIRSTRSQAGREPSVTYRYYLYSHEATTAKEFLFLQRQHWSIENSLHWVLDVTFREDSTHARAEHIAIVLNLFRKLILQLLKHDTTLPGSLSGKREICAWRFDLALLDHAQIM